MKTISKNKKIGIVLVLALIFIGAVVKVIIDGYKGEEPDDVITMEDDVSLKEKDAPDEQRLLTEEDIKEFEEKYDMAGGFYLYHRDGKLVGREDFLELNNGCLDCSFEFMNISKEEIQFTLLLFVDGEIQSFSANGESEKYFYHNKKLASRETDKIKIKLKPNLKGGREEHKIMFYSIFFPVDCYDDKATLTIKAIAEHELRGESTSFNFNTETESYDYTEQITFIDGEKLSSGALYSLALSGEPDDDMTFNKKITADEQNKIYYKLLTANTGTYKAVVLRDGEIIPAFDDNYIIEWEQKEGLLSIIPVDTKIEDLKEHSFLLIFYGEDIENFEVHNSYVNIVRTR